MTPAAASHSYQASPARHSQECASVPVRGGVRDVLEFGASGRTWDAASMRETLAMASPTDLVEILEFDVVKLAPDIALATYRIGRPRPSNRSAIWCRRDGRWQVRFHQGTLRQE